MTGRPLKGRKRAQQFIFCLPGEKETEVKDMDVLARREGKSRGEIILEAWKEYRKIHFPGNPQPPLMAQTEDLSLTDQISVGYMRSRVKSLLETLANPKIRDPSYLKVQGREILIKAARVYDRAKDPELGDLIKRARELLHV